MGGWQNDNYFTRPKCNIIYRAFKQNLLTPPKDARGNTKKPGFVYNYENESPYVGMKMNEEQLLFNAQLYTLFNVVNAIYDEDYEKAQAILDGNHDLATRYYPNGYDMSKMWKNVNRNML